MKTTAGKYRIIEHDKRKPAKSARTQLFIGYPVPNIAPIERMQALLECRHRWRGVQSHHCQAEHLLEMFRVTLRPQVTKCYNLGTTGIWSIMSFSSHAYTYYGVTLMTSHSISQEDVGCTLQTDIDSLETRPSESGPLVVAATTTAHRFWPLN